MVFSNSFHFMEGAFAWQCIANILNQGRTIKIIHTALTSPETFRTGPLGIFTIYKMFERQPNFKEIFEKINPSSIAFSSCPKESFLRLLNKAFQTNITNTELFQESLFSEVITPAVFEEFLFRELLQNTLLKGFVKKISPEHTHFVDHKLYTVCRILITSCCFAALHELNRDFLPDSYVDGQVYSAFYMGIFQGALRETLGLASCIGAHTMNNFIAVLPGSLSRC